MLKKLYFSIINIKSIVNLIRLKIRIKIDLFNISKSKLANVLGLNIYYRKTLKYEFNMFGKLDNTILNKIFGVYKILNKENLIFLKNIFINNKAMFKKHLRSCLAL